MELKSNMDEWENGKWNTIQNTQVKACNLRGLMKKNIKIHSTPNYSLIYL